jgi:hypothetical protein
VAGASVDLYQYLILGKDENMNYKYYPAGMLTRNKTIRKKMNNAEKLAALESELDLLKTQLDRTAHRIDVVIKSINRLREARTSQEENPNPNSHSTQRRFIRRRNAAGSSQIGA